MFGGCIRRTARVHPFSLSEFLRLLSLRSASTAVLFSHHLGRAVPSQALRAVLLLLLRARRRSSIRRGRVVRVRDEDGAMDLSEKLDGVGV